MKRLVSRQTRAAALVLALAAGAPAARALDYHVSPTGNDAGTGGIADPWQTLGKVSTSSFAPGDRILLEGGQTFAGPLVLYADDVGDAISPITVTSYGTGIATIDGGPGNGIVVQNTAGIVVEDLVVRGGWDATLQSGNDGTGILLYNDLLGAVRLSFLRLRRLEVLGFKRGGIVVGAYPADASKSGFADVVIEDVEVHDNGDSGISSYGRFDAAAVDYAHRDLTVRHARVHDNRGVAGKGNNSGNGIVLSDVDGALVERSEAFANGDLCDHLGGGPVGIWAWDAKRVVLQHNESHHNRTGALSLDGGGFDLDGGVTESLVQYNYAHDNDGAGYLLYQFSGARSALSGNVVRYNVSENDGRAHGYSGIYLGGGAAVSDNHVYGNTVYMTSAGSGGTAVILSDLGTGNTLRNNILMTAYGARLLDSGTANTPASVVFQGNVWYAGTDPLDFRIRWGGTPYTTLAAFRATGQEMDGTNATGLDVDPLLTAPGAGGTIGNPDDLRFLAAYRLQAGSPAIDTGLDLLARYAVDPGPVDFYGTSLPQGVGLDIGAHEWTACVIPGIVGNTLKLVRSGADIVFTWTDILDANEYRIYEDAAKGGTFPGLTGTAPTGLTGLTAPEPAVDALYRVAGASPCGEGPK
jgi:hypothetical protein